jgi:hypothetical protein
MASVCDVSMTSMCATMGGLDSSGATDHITSCRTTLSLQHGGRCALRGRQSGDPGRAQVVVPIVDLALPRHLGPHEAVGERPKRDGALALGVQAELVRVRRVLGKERLDRRDAHERHVQVGQRLGGCAAAGRVSAQRRPLRLDLAGEARLTGY